MAAEIARKLISPSVTMNRIFKELTAGGYIQLNQGRIVLVHSRLPMGF